MLYPLSYEGGDDVGAGSRVLLTGFVVALRSVPLAYSGARHAT